MDVGWVLGIAESVSGFVVMAIVMAWAIQQMSRGLKEGRLSSIELTENAMKLLNEKQAQVEDQNRKIDELYVENRALRSQVYDLHVTVTSLQHQLDELGKQ